MAAKDYRIIRSRRKTMAIEITSEGEVLVRVQMMMSDAAVAGFVEIRREWIEKHLDRIRKKAAQKAQVPKLTGEEKQALIDKALKILLLGHGLFFPGCLIMPMTGMFLGNNGSPSMGGVLALEVWCIYFLPIGILSYMHFRKAEK